MWSKTFKYIAQISRCRLMNIMVLHMDIICQKFLWFILFLCVENVMYWRRFSIIIDIYTLVKITLRPVSIFNRDVRVFASWRWLCLFHDLFRTCHKKKQWSDRIYPHPHWCKFNDCIIRERYALYIIRNYRYVRSLLDII